LKMQFPRIKVLMFGMPEDEEEFISAIRSGAIGYLLKEASLEEIIEGVRSLARNEAVIPRSLSLALVEYAAGIRTYPLRTEHGFAGLTQRERQLLPLLGRGFTNKEIAEKLGISEQTVKNHVHSILSKLNVKSRGAITLQPASPPSFGALVSPPPSVLELVSKAPHGDS
ncbi:MAG TPA: response regulator transcription factor, partial [Terriglobia bacterium]|nr:response regulator transcription factor [Terriglobia bacterium]